MPLPLMAIGAGLQGLNAVGSIWGSLNAAEEQRKARQRFEAEVKQNAEQLKNIGALKQAEASDMLTQAGKNRNVGRGLAEDNARNQTATAISASGRRPSASTLATSLAAQSQASNQANQGLNRQYQQGRAASLNKSTEAAQQNQQASNLLTSLAQGNYDSASRMLGQYTGSAAKSISDLGGGLIQNQAYKDAARDLAGTVSEGKPAGVRGQSGIFGGGNKRRKAGSTMGVDTTSYRDAVDLTGIGEGLLHRSGRGRLTGMAEGGELPEGITPEMENKELEGDTQPARVVGSGEEIALEPHEVILSNADQDYVLEGVDLEDKQSNQEVYEVGKRILEVLKKYDREEKAEAMRGEEPEGEGLEEEMQEAQAPMPQPGASPMAKGGKLGGFDFGGLGDVIGGVGQFASGLINGFAEGGETPDPAMMGRSQIPGDAGKAGYDGDYAQQDPRSKWGAPKAGASSVNPLAFIQELQMMKDRMPMNSTVIEIRPAGMGERNAPRRAIIPNA